MVRWYRSLFLRIFLWFWSIVILAMGAAVGTILWLEDNYYRTATPQEVRHLALLIENQRPVLAEERRLWRRLRPGWNLVITPIDSIGQLPHDLEQFADAAAEQSEILWGQDDGYLMIGPVTRGGYIYVAVARKDMQYILQEEDRWVVPVVMAVVVTLLCFLLAWTLTRPVLRLQRAVRRLAGGDFDMTALSDSYRRHDEIGALTDEVISMAASLQSLLHSHQQLLRDVSHELRSPLTRLQIALAIARKKDTNDVLVAEHDRIERAVGQVDNLIGQMLDLARLQQQDETELLIESDDLKGRLTEWLDDADIECRSRGLTVRRHWSSGAVDADWDWLLVERAFDNILRNAIRFSPEGGDLLVGCDVRDGVASISVQDQGPGVPEEELGRIFDAFTQVDSARDHAAGGYGIGLALVKRITELHSGQVIAENVAPGLKVTLRLPLNPENTPKPRGS
ncbi:sensor histidine kinase [Thalassolituus sp.]|uniref:sensor histidine kinase n=1 Tax=Thalassolituus sp. TaxID=2030822 RepID=UPI0035172F93